MISNARRDTFFRAVIRFLTAVSAGVILLVCVFVARESFLAFQSTDFQLSDILQDEAWNPGAGEFDLKPMIVGSLFATFGSALLTAPLGIGLAVFLNFYAPAKIGWFFRRLVEVMAGVPSVVYGLWGLSVLVPLIASCSPIEQGQSLLAGVLILSFMTIPTVAIASDAAIQAVPDSHVAAATALGLNRRSIAWSIVLPAARFGLISAVILQIARAIGETMAVLMVCGNIVQIPGSVFEPVRTLTANIALEMGYADEQHRAILFLSGLVGLVLVAMLMVGANLSSKRNQT